MSDTDWTVFALYVDQDLFKRAAFNNKTKEFVKILHGETAQDAVERAGLQFNKAV